MQLVAGTPVMALNALKHLRDQKDIGIVNGEWLDVVKWDEKHVHLQRRREDVEERLVLVEHDDFMCWFVVAHAITTHKAQSAEYPFKYCVWEAAFMQSMAKKRDDDLGQRLLYTALSRAKEIEGTETPKLIKIATEAVPKTLRDMWEEEYVNSKVYLVKSKKGGNQYVGSTTRALEGRLNGHKNNYEKKKAGKYRYNDSVFEVLKHGDAEIELLSAVECRSRQELLTHEGRWQRKLNCVNKRMEKTWED